MEAYSGVLVCCTNLLADLDPAALRLFDFKVGFKPLTREGHAIMFNRFFSNTELT